MYILEDGGIGRHMSPQCTTIRRNTTNLKMRNTQNCQRITQKEHPEMYRSPTTTDLKKLYSSRRVGGLRRRVGRRGLCVAAASQGQRGRGAERRRGSEPVSPGQTVQPRALHLEKESLITSGCKPGGGWGGGRNCQFLRRALSLCKPTHPGNHNQDSS